MKNLIIFSIIGMICILSFISTNTIQVNAITFNSSIMITSISLNSTNPLTNDTNQNITSHLFNASSPNIGANISFSYRWWVNSSLVAQSPFFDNSLVLYMPFDNDARDYANGNDGTVSDATLNKTDFKVGSGAYSFDGVNDYILISNLNISALSNWTISSWSKSLDGSQDSIFGQEQGGGYLFQLQYDGVGYHFRGKVGAGWFDYYSHIQTPNTNPVLNQWNNLVVVFNGTDLRMFINNIPLSWKNTGGTFVSSTDTLLKFGVANIGNYPFNGSIDDIVVWNRTLSQSEITLIYNAGIGKYGTELLSNFSKKNDNITVEVTPIDYLDWGTAVNSSILKVGNIVPTKKADLPNVTLNEDFSLYRAVENLTIYFEDYDVNESIDNLYYEVRDENTSQLDCSIGYENTTGLVLKIDVNNGTLKDNSPVGNTLTNYGSTIVNGYVGKGINTYRGTYLKSTTIPSIGVKRSFSVSLWVNTYNNANVGVILTQIISSSDRISLTTQSGDMRFGLYDGTTYFTSVSGAINLNVWKIGRASCRERV